MPFFSSRIGLACAAVFATGWLALVGMLASRFSLPSADAILYSLPLAAARHPFDLGIPFLEGFSDYGSAWGHHWPGSMWVKGLIFSVLPYSRSADVIVLSLFQLLVATVAANAVRTTTSNRWLAAGVWILLLSDRLLLFTCAWNRFEPIAVAAILVWFNLAFIQTRPLPPAGIWSARAAAFLSPTLHPYAVALGAMIAAFDLFQCRRHALPVKESAIRLGCFLLGGAAAASWFVFQPEALRQFTANVSLQNTFYQSWNTVVSGLGNYRLGSGLLLWGVALVAGLSLAFGLVRIPSTDLRSAAFRYLAPALFIAVIAIHTVTHCENYAYLTFGTPFAAMIVAVLAGSVYSNARTDGASGKIAWAIPSAVFALILFLHATILPYRILQFVRAGCPDLQNEIASVLRTLPQDKAVYIPHLMWAAAAQEQGRPIRWFTFPAASSPAVRRDYESVAYSRAKPGDLLIVDNLDAASIDRFGTHPTFPVLPPDPQRWVLVGSKKFLLPGSVPWGIDLSIYQFAGEN
jgi:hypothetical protein